MSAEMDALTVVNQLRDLAADPLNRRAIVEDQGCLPGLILFLDHPNPQVIYSALLVRSINRLCIQMQLRFTLSSFIQDFVCSGFMHHLSCVVVKNSTIYKKLFPILFRIFLFLCIFSQVLSPLLFSIVSRSR